MKVSHIFSYLMIVLILVLVFIIPCKEWNFVAEDYPIIYRVASIKNFKEFCKIIFIQANVVKLWDTQNPLNPKIKMEDRRCFFDSLYRPGLMLVHFVEYHLFGINAYLYHLFIVFLHLLNSLLLFYILRKILAGWISFLCTIFFTCNSTLIVWFGKIDTQQHQINLLLFLLLCLCLICLFSIEKISNALLVFIGLLQFLCLSLREVYIIMPLIILFLIPFTYKVRIINLKKILLVISVLIGATLLYIFMKQIYYPFYFNESVHGISILHCMRLFKNFIFNFIQESYCVVLSMLINHKIYFFCEHNNFLILYKIIKNLLFVLLIYLFLINQKKLYVLYLSICMTLFFWPKFLIPYFSLRHFYEILPFACVIVGLLLQYNKYSETRLYRYVICALFLFLIFVNSIFIVHFERIESKNWRSLSCALESLKMHYTVELKYNPIIVLNTKSFDSTYYNVGIIEAVQLNFMQNKQPKILLNEFSPDLRNSKFKLFCRWLSDCKTQFITLLIWNKLNNNFDLKIIPNFVLD